MDFRKIFFGFALLIFGSSVFGQGDLVVATDTTVYAYNLVDDSSSTANGLVDQFDSQFEQDSVVADLESLFLGEFVVTFELTSVEDFGKVQVELAKWVDGLPVLLSVNTFTSNELVNSAALTGNDVIIKLSDSYNTGTYSVSILVFTSEGSALRVLTKTIIL